MLALGWTATSARLFPCLPALPPSFSFFTNARTQATPYTPTPPVAVTFFSFFTYEGRKLAAPLDWVLICSVAVLPLVGFLLIAYLRRERALDELAKGAVNGCLGWVGHLGWWAVVMRDGRQDGSGKCSTAWACWVRPIAATVAAGAHRFRRGKFATDGTPLPHHLPWRHPAACPTLPAACPPCPCSHGAHGRLFGGGESATDRY